MEIKNMLEKKYKWIVSILILIGIGFIIDLGLTGLRVTWGGGGFIDLGLSPNFEYYWISAGYIAVVLFLISIYLTKVIKKIKNKIKKIQIAFLILFLGLIGKQIFFLASPDFKFYFTPVTSQYKDKDRKITDIDKYLELTAKYCNDFKEGDDFDFMYSRETMCSGKFKTDFGTVEEYIKVLEYTKNHDFRYLYQSTFRWVDENVGLENLINKYEDDTFYAYVILKGGLLRKERDKLRKKIKNQKILDLINFYDDSIIQNQKFLEDNLDYNSSLFWDNFDKELRKKIKQIPEINQKIF